MDFGLDASRRPGMTAKAIGDSKIELRQPNKNPGIAVGVLHFVLLSEVPLCGAA